MYAFSEHTAFHACWFYPSSATSNIHEEQSFCPYSIVSNRSERQMHTLSQRGLLRRKVLNAFIISWKFKYEVLVEQ